jgi:hypothetical protein
MSAKPRRRERRQEEEPQAGQQIILVAHGTAGFNKNMGKNIELLKPPWDIYTKMTGLRQ